MSKVNIFVILILLSLVLRGSSASDAEELSFKEKVFYFSSVAFDVSYYQDLYDLELRHHGTLSRQNVTFLKAKAESTRAEKNYKLVYEAQKTSKLPLNEMERQSIYKELCHELKGSSLAGLFIYVKLDSMDLYKDLVFYYVGLAKQFRSSGNERQREMVRSWNDDKIPIPMMSENGNITWSNSSVYSYITRSNKPKEPVLN